MDKEILLSHALFIKTMYGNYVMKVLQAMSNMILLLLEGLKCLYVTNSLPGHTIVVGTGKKCNIFELRNLMEKNMNTQ